MRPARPLPGGGGLHQQRQQADETAVTILSICCWGVVLRARDAEPGRRTCGLGSTRQGKAYQ